MFRTGLIAGLLLSSTAQASAEGSLFVHIKSVDVARGGNLAVYVYTDADNWLKPELRVYGKIVPVTKQSVRVELPRLPYGEYAVSVIQDLNGNEKIDMDWFPIPGPAEPTGVSNNASATFGAPSFEDAKVQLNKPKKALLISLDD